MSAVVGVALEVVLTGRNVCFNYSAATSLRQRREAMTGARAAAAAVWSWRVLTKRLTHYTHLGSDPGSTLQTTVTQTHYWTTGLQDYRDLLEMEMSLQGLATDRETDQ